MRRLIVAICLIVAGGVTAEAQTEFYFPQIAHGVQDAVYAWQTTIFLTNPAAVGSGAVSGSITFTAPNGTPFELAFVDEAGQQSSGAAIGFQIAGGQTKKYVSTGNVPLVSGFATVRTASGVVSGAALFTQFKNGILFAEAGVSASAKVLRQAVIVDTTGGFDTGVAFANSGTSATPTTLKLINVEGSEVMSTTTEGGNPTFHTAKFVSSMFLPRVPPPMVGTLQISNSAPLAAVGLRFAPSGVFTTVPTVTLASIIQPALQWLQQKPWLSPFSSFARLLAGVQFRLG